MVEIAVRLLAFIALALGGWLAIDWMLDPRLPEVLAKYATSKEAAQEMFPLAGLQVAIGWRAGWSTAPMLLAYAATALTMALAAVLAAWLSWRGLQQATVRHLALGLSLAVLCVTYFWFAREFAPTRSQLVGYAPMLDYLAMLCGVFAWIALVACFRNYPEPFSRALVERQVSSTIARNNERGRGIRAGAGLWRLWAWLPEEQFGRYGRTRQPERHVLLRLFASREMLWLLVTVTGAFLATLHTSVLDYLPTPVRFAAFAFLSASVLVIVDPLFGARIDHDLVNRLQRQTSSFDFALHLHRWFGHPLGLMLVALLGVGLTLLWHQGHFKLVTSIQLIGLLLLAGHALSLLYLNWRLGAAQQRHAIAWIFLGTAGAAALWLAAMNIALLLMFSSSQVELFTARLRWVGAGMALGPPFIALAFVLSLWASILHRGSFDPGLALRRGAGYAVLGVVLTACFVAVEGALSSLVVVHLGMPSQSGPVLAGTAVALGFGPLRERVDRGVQRMMQRILPPEAVAAGERRECAIVFSDLSGYTRLAEIDEEEAVTLAAILHRNARIVADANGGRVVKTIGDAVLCVYQDAMSALAASTALHAGYRAECAQRDCEALPVHSGLHVGELVIAPDGDVFGAHVNLAARLQTLAGPDELVASTTAAAAIAASALPAESLPARRFKNIAEPVDCLRVRLA